MSREMNFLTIGYFGITSDLFNKVLLFNEIIAIENKEIIGTDHGKFVPIFNHHINISAIIHKILETNSSFHVK